MAAALSATLLARSLELQGRTDAFHWPSTRYQDDPVAFAREVLGVEPWSKQVEILEAVRDHKRVAVASGHKVSKSHTDAIVALWFFCSFPDARVVMSSVTSRQVDQILWRELRMMRSRASRPIEGDMHELARSGLKAVDFREIVGFTAREAEAVAGISGKNLLYILDEASGIPEAIFEAIEGNRAGGARVLMTSNPTRTEGEFFEAFHAKKRFYRTIQVSSEETPNAISGKDLIPGLATRAWIEEKREEWGPESPQFKVRILGQFPVGESGKIMSLHLLTESAGRWEETPAEGRLQIGVDPAGPDGSSDESAFSCRRGMKQLSLTAMLGLTEQGITAHVVGMISALRKPQERPLVCVDRGGQIGSKAFHALKEAGERNAFDVVGVFASNNAIREPLIYDTIRDELVANLARWIKDGGAILTDTKLEQECHCPEWVAYDKKQKVTPKKEMRKLLGRSPDRLDATALSVWVPRSHQDEDAPAAKAAPVAVPVPYTTPVRPILDPYAAAATWGRR